MSQSQRSLFSGEMPDRMEQPGHAGAVERGRRTHGKSLPIVCECDTRPPASSVWVVCLMRLDWAVRHPLSLVLSVHQWVRWGDWGVDWDSAGWKMILEYFRSSSRAEGFCQCHLQDRWEWRCLCYVSEPDSAISTGVLRDRWNFGPHSPRNLCLCVSTMYSFSVWHCNGICQVELTFKINFQNKFKVLCKYVWKFILNVLWRKTV